MRTQNIKIKSSSPILEGCKEFNAIFKKHVQIPVDKIQSIEHSRTPQRCLLHNNTLTLYCESDHKPLCAGCMYQSDFHRKHRVIPLNKGIPMMKEDIKSFQIKLQDVAMETITFKDKVNERMILNDKLYLQMKEKLKKYYQQFHQILREKQKQQLEQIKEFKQLSKKQCTLLVETSSKTIEFIQKKANSYQSKEGQDLLTTRRSVLENLMKSKTILRNNLFQLLSSKSKTITNLIEKFESVKLLILGKLTLNPPAQPQEKPRSKSTISSRNKSQNSPALSPKNSIRSRSKTPQKNVFKLKN